MRARLSLIASQQQCELREIVLRDKPQDMLDASPKGTVPVMILPDGTAIDESLDIMVWALHRSDPDNMLPREPDKRREMIDFVSALETGFKGHLDRYKYADRYQKENNGEGVDAEWHRTQAMAFLDRFETRLVQSRNLFGDNQTLADIATAPFVRQFANTDRDWFSKQAPPKLKNWLQRFLESDLFQNGFKKYPVWQTGSQGIIFPDV